MFPELQNFFQNDQQYLLGLFYRGEKSEHDTQLLFRVIWELKET